MIDKSDESDGVSGYRIERSKRLDGICITFEYKNFEWTLKSQEAQRYRIYIDYTNSFGHPVTVCFKDGKYESGDLEADIKNKILKYLPSLSPSDRKNLRECISLESSSESIENLVSIEEI